MRIGVSSKALFDLSESSRVFEEQGLQAYLRHHQELEDVPLTPGAAYPLVARLLKLNELCGEGGETLVEVIVLSGLHPDAGVRVMRSLQHHGLAINRAAFTGGNDVVPYLDAFDIDLFLSQSREDVQDAINLGHAAALMYEPPKDFEKEGGPIRIAFDGDAVLFSPASELIYKRSGLDAFRGHEMENARIPLTDGPLAKVFRTICTLHERAPEGQELVRISLVTMRDGGARERAMRTFRAWGVAVDEAYFLGGVPKAKILAALKPHIFFDDQDVHLRNSREFTPVALVPYKQEGDESELLELAAR